MQTVIGMNIEWWCWNMPMMMMMIFSKAFYKWYCLGYDDNQYGENGIDLDVNNYDDDES